MRRAINSSGYRGLGDTLEAWQLDPSNPPAGTCSTAVPAWQAYAARYNVPIATGDDQAQLQAAAYTYADAQAACGNWAQTCLSKQGCLYVNYPLCRPYYPDWPTNQTLSQILAADPHYGDTSLGYNWLDGPALARGFRALNYTQGQIDCFLSTAALRPNVNQSIVDYQTWVSLGKPMGPMSPVYNVSNQTPETQAIIAGQHTVGTPLTDAQLAEIAANNLAQTGTPSTGASSGSAGSTAAPSGGASTTPAAGSSAVSFSLSSIPTWAYLAAAGVVVLMVVKK